MSITEQANRSVRSLKSAGVTLDLVGGKGLSLCKLATSKTNNLRVPPGFILTTETYRKFVDANNLSSSIQTVLANINNHNTDSIESASSGIASLFTGSTIPPDLTADILRAYVELGEPAVAVRSSATAEDLPDLSFAGQQDTYLNIRGETALLEAVRNCWASLWTARAIDYRLKMNIDQKQVKMGLVIQTMVEAEVSGILFTANPINGERSEIVINASYGLGEAIVAGHITPDNYILDRQTLNVKNTVIGTKEEQIVPQGELGVTSQSVAPQKRSESSMLPTAIRELAALSIDIEAIFDQVPQDIEWACKGGIFYILQSRPITRLPVQPLHDVQWLPEYEGGKLIRRQVVENMPDPLSPLFAELYLQVGLEQSLDRFMDQFDMPVDIGELLTRPFFVTVNGYAYCKADYKIPWRQIPKLIVWSIKMMPAMLRDVVSQWGDEALPAYLETVRQWNEIELDTATDKQLMSGIRTLAIADAIYWLNVTMVMGFAKMTDGALHFFLNYMVRGELISGMFLRGFSSKTLDSRLELEVIARRIQAVPSLRNLVATTPASDLMNSLSQHEEGAWFGEDIRAYLQKYGHLVYTLDFSQETQIENPLPVLMNLKTLVVQENHDTNGQQAELVRERDLLEQSTLRAIGPIRRWMFRKLLRWAQGYGPYREGALFYMGAGWPTLRKLALELGRRLVDIGTISYPREVFYLTTDELSVASTARQTGQAVSTLGDKANERWELREARKQLHPPPMVPEGRFKFGFVDLSFIETQKRNRDDNPILKGFAVSPGKVTGTASVIMSPADFADMRPDTILVCPTTTPAWTPLFSQASALVTDIGGILAHGSIVAREYGIPAVMGTGNITRRIVTGQRIAVDGEAGTVTILDDGHRHPERSRRI